MSWEFWFTLTVVVAMIVGLVQERLSPDTLVLGALVLLMLFGIVTPEQGLSGFANPAVATIGALFVVAAAVHRTGGLQVVSEGLFGQTRALRRVLLRLTGITTVASAFLNNTPVVAMFMPSVMTWARRAGISPSKLLIPLSYAAIVGGVCTLIGTSTNLVVSGMLQNVAGQAPLGMFELTLVGAPLALIAIFAVAWLGPRLLPARVDVLDEAGGTQREYLLEMRVGEDSPLIGRSIEEAGLRHLRGLFLVRIERASGIISPVGPQQTLRADDRLTFAGVVDTIVDVTTRFRGLEPIVHDRPPEADHRWRLHEAVVAAGSGLVGQNIRQARFRGRYNAAVVAVHRRGERIESKIGDIFLHPGDVLLIEAAPGFGSSYGASPDFYLVNEVEQSEPPNRERARIATAILIGVVALASTGVVPVVIVALAGAGAAVALRCLTPGDARRSVDWSVLIAIAASLGVAQGLVNSGVAPRFAELLVELSGGLGPVAVLVTIYFVTMLLTEVVSNAAAAALLFPAAIAAATAVGS
ncbi:MAG: SLC13 family permease, partial [Proteobacteria bacterium]|nr:SLC13 family permease [Pseudomonadota bacterium]